MRTILSLLAMAKYFVLFIETKKTLNLFEKYYDDMFFSTEDPNLIIFIKMTAEMTVNELSKIQGFEDANEKVKVEVAQLIIISSYFEPSTDEDNTKIPLRRLKSKLKNCMPRLGLLFFYDIKIKRIPSEAFEYFKGPIALLLFKCEFLDQKWTSSLETCLPGLTDLGLIDCNLKNIPDVSGFVNMKFLAIHEINGLKIDDITTLKLFKNEGTVKINREMISNKKFKELKKAYKERIKFSFARICEEEEEESTCCSCFCN